MEIPSRPKREPIRKDHRNREYLKFLDENGITGEPEPPVRHVHKWTL